MSNWTGDLNDDCMLVRDGMTAHVECMGRGSWWCGVYLDRTELFNSGEQQYPISLTTGKMARACAECVMEVLRER